MAADEPVRGDDRAPPVPLRIEVVYCPGPGRCDIESLELPAGATVGDAIRAAGVLDRHRLTLAALRAGVWGRVLEMTAPLRDRDRVEVYRPLQVDPKQARRERYRRHVAARPARER
jgi:uncharacterized protein